MKLWGFFGDGNECLISNKSVSASMEIRLVTMEIEDSGCDGGKSIKSLKLLYGRSKWNERSKGFPLPWQFFMVTENVDLVTKIYILLLWRCLVAMVTFYCLDDIVAMTTFRPHDNIP